MPEATAVRDDLAFLRNLDDQVSRIVERFPTTRRDFNHDVRLTPNEVEMLIEIISNRKDLIFQPVNTNCGYSVGFVVSRVTQYPGGHEEERVLEFLEKQLPDGYDFDKLSSTFLSKKNVDAMEYLGMKPIVNRRSHYNY